MALPPCHAMFQFYVEEGRLSCKLIQRSADVFLGVPFNIASYSLLTHMVAQQCDLEVGEFIWSGGDCHLYLNHLEQAQQQLQRKPYDLPQLLIKTKQKICSVTSLNILNLKIMFVIRQLRQRSQFNRIRCCSFGCSLAVNRWHNARKFRRANQFK